MKSKSGKAVPKDLSSAIRKNPAVLKMWCTLRPSCQRSYIKYLLEAKRPETRKNRIPRIVKMTKDYYKRHKKGSARVLKIDYNKYRYMAEDMGELVRTTRSTVSKTLSAMEVAIANWKAMKDKPPEYEKTMQDMERLHGMLEQWATSSLKNRDTKPEAQKKDLLSFVNITKMFRGAF